MTIDRLRSIIKENGIVGAGGAGFPTYMKIDQRADIILLNCAECEPLLKLHQQLLKEYVKEIVSTFSLIADIMEAGEAIIGIKAEYRDTIAALQSYVPNYQKVRIHLLESSYPMGDEIVLIYEATGKAIRPGGLPIEAGITVFNVETVYNIHRAVNQSFPVTEKYVTIVGEVENPCTVRVPVGTILKDAVAMAGGETILNGVYLIGGPMMGRIGSRYESVTKTTNAIIVLPEDHIMIQKKRLPASLSIKRAASACCLCRTCTDLCPRYNLGYKIEPHRFMQAVSNHNYKDTEAYLNIFFCSGCGLCELFSCPQGLSPRSLIGECKEGLLKCGVKSPVGEEGAAIKEARKYRKAPELRLAARAGLTKYEKDAPLTDSLQEVKKVRLLFSQHIGAPAICSLTKGDIVSGGQVIAHEGEGLSVPVHASISGVIAEITDTYVEIVSIS